jgi:hypothetical protein
MTEYNKYEVADLINYTVDRKPVEFGQAFDDLVIDRIRTAVEDKKLQIAQQMYGYEPPEDFETDEYEDDGASDTELEDSEED